MYWDRVAKQYDIFEDAGYMIASFDVVEGRMPCAIAVIEKI